MKKFLKEKLKNKFIYFILLAIFAIIGYQYYFNTPEIDTNTYIVQIKGEVIIFDKKKSIDYKLKEKERKKLEVGDIITTKKDSACVIEWGDGSLTRLGENGKIEIQELNVEKDLSKINLQFKLINGKTWSNVVSFLGEKSYFKQNFEDIEAAVRGTVFDVNLEKDYIYVENHEIIAKKQNKKVIIPQEKPFSISKFSFIELQKFLEEIKDKAWENFNIERDNEFLNNLKNNISKKIDLKNLDNILEENQTYNELLAQYQKLNFAKVTDGELFEAKNKLKKALISKASDEDKKILVKYSYYDYKDFLKSKVNEKYDYLLEIINENKSLIPNLDINKLDKYLDEASDSLNKLKKQAIKDGSGFINFIKNLLK